jgi:ketosteroid isomerase-like protein
LHTSDVKRPRAVVLAFVKRINEHDPEGLARLMTEDHVFVDSLGRSFKGREEMRKGWLQYFNLFEDYTISITDIFEKRGSVALFGTARGTHVNRTSLKKTRWDVPAAWKAVITKGLVSEWRVFADNYETMKLVSGG